MRKPPFKSNPGNGLEKPQKPKIKRWTQERETKLLLKILKFYIKIDQFYKKCIAVRNVHYIIYRKRIKNCPNTSSVA